MRSVLAMTFLIIGLACQNSSDQEHDRRLEELEKISDDVEPVVQAILKEYAQLDAKGLRRYFSRILLKEMSLEDYQKAMDHNPSQWRNAGQHSVINSQKTRYVPPYAYVFIDSPADEECWAFVREDGDWKLRATSDNFLQLIQFLDQQGGNP